MTLEFSDEQWAKWQAQYDRARNEFLEEWYPTLVRYAKERWSLSGVGAELAHEAVLTFIEQGFDPSVQSPEDALWTYLHRAGYRYFTMRKFRAKRRVSLGEAERLKTVNPFPTLDAKLDAETLLRVTTPRQRELITALLYGYTVNEIAAMQGVRRNGISRAVAWGLNRMAQYGGVCTNTNERNEKVAKNGRKRRPTLSVIKNPKPGAP